MSQVTLDTLIDQLVKLREMGAPGDIPVLIWDTDYKSLGVLQWNARDNNIVIHSALIQPKPVPRSEQEIAVDKYNKRMDRAKNNKKIKIDLSKLDKLS